MRYFAFVSVLAVATSIPLNQDQDRTREHSDSDDARIYDGMTARVGQFPWQVLVSFNNNVCGGSLISNQWVLTAAHCIWGISGLVRVGCHFLRNHTGNGCEHINLTSASKHMHPDYDYNTKHHDIALIKLPQALEFSDTKKAVPLYNRTEYLGVDINTTISGWGIGRNETFHDELQYVQAKTIDNAQCKRTYGTVIQNSTLCTQGYNAWEGAKPGDSGGALVMYDGNDEATQIGVVFFTLGWGYPRVYSRVEYYLEWINEVTGSLYP